jgi:16S rRNA (uracil1498-N3)-methyltransferase
MAERFYLRQEFEPHLIVSLKDAEHHHLKVIRLRSDEEIELVNGTGTLAQARILKIDKEHTSLEILSIKKHEKIDRKISLGIPFMRPSKLEWIIEKGTEIGADAFFLYPAENSTQEFLNHQIERFGNIMISALKQSKRLFLPHLEILPHLDTLFKKGIPIYFGCTRKDVVPIPSIEGDLLFITGPESGFSNQEIVLLSKVGRGIRLNCNILRAETAPLVALSLFCSPK